jgi:membrane carboxypeptidase/penicillin-binding protein
MLVTLLGAYALACSYVYLVPTLPSIESMRNVELQVPLRVYTRSGALIAQIGEQRRIPASYDQIPELVKHAFLAAEDERFFEHHGIDYFGVVRAVGIDFEFFSRVRDQVSYTAGFPQTCSAVERGDNRLSVSHPLDVLALQLASIPCPALA